MTATSIPLAAGSAVLGSAGRICTWTAARYMRAPLATTAVLAMTALSLAGAAHALYFESGRHPAPLFASPAAPAVVTEAPRPAHPRPAPHQDTPTVSSLISNDTTGSLPADAAPAPEMAPEIGNADVAAVQEKLAKLGLFQGTVDGYYGPRTADAIRAFEKEAGLKPVGALQPDVVKAIIAAPLAAPPAVKVASVPDTPPMPAPLPADLATGSVTKAAAAPADEPDQHHERLALGPARVPAQVRLASAPVSEQALPAATPRGGVATVGTTPPAPPQKLGPVESPAMRLLDAAGETAAGAFDALADLVTDATGERDAVASGSLRRTPTRPAQVANTDAATVRDAPRAPRIAATVAVPTMPTAVPTVPIDPQASSTDPVLVAKVQRGLASLGFLAGSADGVANESTAKAIRNFEVYYDYPVTGRVSPQLLSLLEQAGAVI